MHLRCASQLAEQFDGIWWLIRAEPRGPDAPPRLLPGANATGKEGRAALAIAVHLVERAGGHWATIKNISGLTSSRRTLSCCGCRGGGGRAAAASA
eukprot:4341930-Pyramimonas_sp.AAC.1